jgi:carbamoyl-phosphate synthase large subunit
MINVLLTGAGGNLSHFIHRALLRASLDVRIIACDYSSNAVGLFLAEAGYVVPPARSEAYLPKLVEICRNEEIHIVLVGGIVEMRVLAARRDELLERTGAFAVTSPPEALDRMADKYQLARALAAAGFQAPETVLPSDHGRLERFCEEHGFPCIVKDRLGSGGSIGLGVARDRRQLTYMIEQIPNPIVQEYLYPDDEEYTVGAFVESNGKAAASIVVKRQLGLGLTFKGQVLPESELGGYCERILETLGCLGPANLQLRLTKRGPVVFEINPRFSSTTSARAHYGYNEPEMCIRHFVLKEPVSRPVIRPGRFFRTIEDVFVEEEDFRRLDDTGVIRRSRGDR